MKRILVTGGTGYIGSHTCISLLEKGYDVTIVDNLVNSKALVVDRIENLSGKKVKFFEADVCDEDALRKIFAEDEIFAVIHFAGLKAVGESVQIPLRYYENNLISTLSLLKVMAEFKVNNFVFSSSATVYGNPASVPIREDFPLSTTNPYGTTKLMIERILKDYAHANPDFNPIILRYFNPVARTRAAPSAKTRTASRTTLCRISRRWRWASCAASAFSATITRRRTAPACAITFMSSTLQRAMWRRSRNSTIRTAA